MHRSLYLRLLRQQSTPERSNLENFLTEGLCDLLNRFSAGQQAELLARLRLPKVVSEGGSTAPLDWESQQTVAIPGYGNKRPDLIGFVGGRPAYLVEVKVNAGFTQGGPCADAGENVLPKKQLEMYGTWLHAANPEGCLVLLTHGSRPPDDFFDEEHECAYGTKRRRCLSWQELYDALAHFRALPLVSDYRTFLKEEGLAMDAPNRRDFALLEMFMGGASDRIGHLMGTIRDRLREKYPAGVNWGSEETHQGSKGYAMRPAEHLIWGWGILRRASYSYIAWGVYFPTGEEIAWNWQAEFPELPQRPVVFTFISLRTNEEIETFRQNFQSSFSWMQCSPQQSPDVCLMPLLAVTPLDDLLTEKDPAEAMFTWIDKRFADLHAAAEKLPK